MNPETVQEHSPPLSVALPQVARGEALAYLEGRLSLYALFARAAELRERYFARSVRVHVLDNIQNGNCAEDCGYCAQRRTAASGIEPYPLKSDEAIFTEAQAAKKAGAYRFCMVSSGTGPSHARTEKLARLIRRITDELGLRVCLSAGLLDQEKAHLLAAAGLDRYNHNLNTSEAHYSAICTTHSYADRVATLEAVASAGVGLCSGVIVGLGESPADLIETAFALKKLRVVSIPVNFFLPIKNHAIRAPQLLSPEYCLRVLVVFRLVNPDAEIRMAAGREEHLRNLQAMALMVANSLFAEGYLNTPGDSMAKTLELIRDAGMTAELG